MSGSGTIGAMRQQLEALLLTASRSDAIDGGLIDEAYRLVLGAARDGLRIERAGIWLLQPARSVITCELLIGDSGEPMPDAEDLILTRTQFPRYFEALDSERAILAHDACNDPRTSEFTDVYLRPLGISSMLDVPIRHRGEMVGIICCEHIGPVRAWRIEEAAFAASLADLVGRAITASKRVEAERSLRAANAELESALLAAKLARREAELANEAKTRFLAGMSHDLRTPLTTVLGFCELLIDDATTGRTLADARRDLDAMRGAACHILDLTDDIIDVTRIESGHLHLDLRPCAIGALMDECLPVVQSLVARNGNRLEIAVDEGADLVLADRRGLRQILVNLLDNAAKFTNAGTVRFSASREPDASERRIALCVHDTGVGIEPAYFDRIFNRFFQADTHRPRRAGSTGLGLSISRSLAEAMGGSISVESRPGVGSTFTVRLPAAPMA